MALTRGRLSNVTVVSAGATSAAVTVASNKKVYVKSIAIHDGSATAGAGVACTAHVYVVPNGGAVGDATRMFNVCLLYTSPSPRDATLSRMPSSA